MYNDLKYQSNQVIGSKNTFISNKVRTYKKRTAYKIIKFTTNNKIYPKYNNVE